MRSTNQATNPPTGGVVTFTPHLQSTTRGGGSVYRGASSCREGCLQSVCKNPERLGSGGVHLLNICWGGGGVKMWGTRGPTPSWVAFWARWSFSWAYMRSMLSVSSASVSRLAGTAFALSSLWGRGVRVVGGVCLDLWEAHLAVCSRVMLGARGRVHCTRLVHPRWHHGGAPLFEMCASVQHTPQQTKQ